MSNVRSLTDHLANHAIMAFKSLLEATPEGEKLKIPQTRREYEMMRERIKDMLHMEESVALIDFTLEQEKLGRIEFLPEK